MFYVVREFHMFLHRGKAHFRRYLGRYSLSYPARLINHIYWNTKYSFIREQSHRNHFTAIKRLLKTKSMSEIKDMYDRHPSIKSITSITVITRRVAYRFFIDWSIQSITFTWLISIDIDCFNTDRKAKQSKTKVKANNFWHSIENCWNSETKSNRVLLAHVVPPLAPGTCAYLWFGWFGFTTLKYKPLF